MKKYVSIFTAAAMTASLAIGGTMNAFASKSVAGESSIFVETESDIDKSDIAAADITAPVVKDLTYNGEPQALITAGSVKNNIGTMMYASSSTSSGRLPTDADWSEEIPMAIYADEYDIWYKVVGDASHNDVDPVTLKGTIGQKEVELGLSEDVFEYNGELQQPTITVSGLIGDDVCNVTAEYSGQSIETGSYTVTATGLSNENYKLPEDSTIFYYILPPDEGQEAPDVMDIQTIVGKWKYQEATGNSTVDVSAKDNGIVTIKADGTYTYTDASGKTTSGTVRLNVEGIGNTYLQAVYFYTGEEFKFGGYYRSETNEITLGNAGLARLVRDNSAAPAATTASAGGSAKTTTNVAAKSNSPKTGVAFPAIPVAGATVAAIAAAFALKKKED